MREEVYEKIIGHLHSCGAGFREVHHEPARTSAESAEARGEALQIGGKAILMKVEDSFKLFVLSAARRIDSSKIKDYFKIKRLRFATPAELMELTGLVPGSVPPFGPPVLEFELYVDTSIGLNERIAFNAGSLTDSIIMDVSEYLRAAAPVIFEFSMPCQEGGTGGRADRGEVDLREVSTADLPVIRNITEEVWRYSFSNMLSDAQIDYMLSGLYSLESMREELEGGKIFYRFIRYKGKRAGFCAFGPTETPGELKIYKLYVLPRFQRHGCGVRVLGYIESYWRGRGGTSLILLVNRRNEGAIRLYRKCGFAVRAKKCTDIGGGFKMDDYLMEKRLA